MSWIDPRVAFLNLKHETYHNILPETEKRFLWCPRVTFSNTPAQDWSVTDNETLVTVRREGAPVVSMDPDTSTVNKFSGRENSMTMTRVYSTSWLCDYDMANYPFDTQICSLLFSPAGISKMFVQLKSGNYVFSGSSELPQYFVR